METYISRRQKKVAHFIVTRPILDLFLEVESRPVVRVAKRCWD